MNTLEKLIGETFGDLDLTQPHLGVGCCEAWDSLAHFNLLMAIEDEFDVRFSTEQITELKTVEQITQALKAKGIQLECLPPALPRRSL